MQGHSRNEYAAYVRQKQIIGILKILEVGELMPFCLIFFFLISEQRGKMFTCLLHAFVANC